MACILARCCPFLLPAWRAASLRIRRCLALAVLAGLPAWAGAALPAPWVLRSAEVRDLTIPRDQVDDALRHAPAELAPPPDSPDWQPQALPDDWSRSRPDRAGTVWYRMNLPNPGLPVGELPVLWIPRVCTGYALWFNGSLLHRSGRLREPQSRQCHRAQLVEVPVALLREEGNRLELAVVGQAVGEVTARQRAAELSEVHFGAQSLLQPRHSLQLLFSVSLAQASALALLLGAALLGAAGWRLRVPALRHLAALGLLQALGSTRLWWEDFPLSHASFEVATATLMVPTAVFGVLFLRRHASIGRSWVEALLWLQVPAAPLAFAAAGAAHRHEVAVALYALLALVLMLAAMVATWRMVRDRRGDLGGLLFATSLTLALVLLEVAVQARWVALPPVHLLHLVMPALFIAATLRMIGQYDAAMRAVEFSRLQAEQRVRDVSERAEREFEFLADQRAELLAQKERKRIAGDLHDDLGAKLLTIVHTSTDERIAALAREALEEMRLSVRGLAGKPVRLGDALADWRAETVGRLAQADIEVDWSSEEPEAHITLPARSYVQTTRILRESVSNMIKHSGASLCRVRCRVDADLLIVIHDNGRGIQQAVDGRLDSGHGMSSMKNRARQMRGQCLVESGPGLGTVIRLTIPVLGVGGTAPRPSELPPLGDEALLE